MKMILRWHLPLLLILLWHGPAVGQSTPIRLSVGDLTFSISPENAKYGFEFAGREVVGADSAAGILVGGSPVFVKGGCTVGAARCVLEGANTTGENMRLTITLTAHHAELMAEPEHPGEEVRFATAGAAPAYGLADHAVEQKLFSTLPKAQFNTDVTGFKDDSFLSGQGAARLVSNFVIFPKQGFAELLVEPTRKIVHTSAEQIVQGVVHAPAQVRLHYFFGTMHEIYAAYREVRNEAGYEVWMPKYEAFGVGWEAFGALAWDTDQQTVTESVDHYLRDGYPLRWIVIGSGFWPSAPEMHETTSFGFWNASKYPTPAAMLQHFHDEKLKIMMGLRITFITNGPYANEGLAHGYFLMKDGKAQAFTGGWPTLPYYLLDAHNPAALDWYMGLVKRWQDYGIDGFKEDFYGYGKYDLRDDKVDPVNDRLMAEHQLVIERNGYLSSNGDLHRINDFNYDQNQDRGPVNALAFAYSGFPLVYPDIVGGTFGENHFATQRTSRMEIYMMRNAQWASVHSSMGMGEPPWSFKPEVAKVMLDAAKLHARIAPYLFSNARRFAGDGYPWTMTPLPIAFPDDPQSYGRENATDRGYEWMIGDAMLAVPLYGEDYATSTTRDVYLPKGQWMDYDSGKIYEGKQMLHGFALPPDKTPILIGGSGVTLEEIGGQVKVCVYPVAQRGSATLTPPESDRELKVRVHGLEPGVAWGSVRVKDNEGRAIKVSVVGHAFVFAPQPGESYTVSASR